MNKKNINEHTCAHTQKYKQITNIHKNISEHTYMHMHYNKNKQEHILHTHESKWNINATHIQEREHNIEQEWKQTHTLLTLRTRMEANTHMHTLE